MLIRCVAAMSLFCVGTAHAAWSGDVEFGYLATSGNTDTESLNGKFLAEYDAGSWSNKLTAGGAYTTDQSDTTAERYVAADTLAWDINERNYLFVTVDWEKDLFAGVRERLSETIGYGRHVLTGPVHTLDLELGAGARQSQDNDTRERYDDAIFRAAMLYGWTISETSKFKQSLKTESGESNTFVESVSELKLAVVGNLYAGLSYTVKYNSDVADGSENTDTYTAVNLSYSFGQK